MSVLKIDYGDANNNGKGLTLEGLRLEFINTSISSAGAQTFTSLSDIKYVSCSGYATFITDDGVTHYGAVEHIVDDDATLAGWKMSINGNVVSYPSFSSQSRGVTFLAFGTPITT